MEGRVYDFQWQYYDGNRTYYVCVYDDKKRVYSQFTLTPSKFAKFKKDLESRELLNKGGES